jgi:hypothetical protein
MALDALRSQPIPSTDSPEVDFALLLSRMIDSLQKDPAELRNAVYEVARIKLKQEVFKETPLINTSELRRVSIALETSISRVEAISSKQDRLDAVKSLDRLRLAEIKPIRAAGYHPNLRIDQSAPGIGPVLNARPRYPTSLLLRGLLVMVSAFVLFVILYDGREFLSAKPSVQQEQASEPPDSPGSIAEHPGDKAADFPLPSFYGIYAVNHGELYELDALPGRVPDQRIFMSAVMSKPSRTLIPDGRIAFVAFRRDLATNAPERASVRVIARVVRAMSFRTAGKAATAALEDLWAIRNISYDFRVSPLSDHPEMLVVRPNDPDLVLVPGRYGMVIKDTGYDFTVAGKITDATQCLERVEAANGTFYSECRKP